MIKVALASFVSIIILLHWIYFTVVVFVNYGVLLGILLLSAGLATLSTIAYAADQQIQKR